MVKLYPIARVNSLEYSGSLRASATSEDIAFAGLLSARLVTVATAESGEARDLKCVVLINEAACRPGAEYNSERFL